MVLAETHLVQVTGAQLKRCHINASRKCESQGHSHLRGDHILVVNGQKVNATRWLCTNAWSVINDTSPHLSSTIDGPLNLCHSGQVAECFDLCERAFGLESR